MSKIKLRSKKRNLFQRIKFKIFNANKYPGFNLIEIQFGGFFEETIFIGCFLGIMLFIKIEEK